LIGASRRQDDGVPVTTSELSVAAANSDEKSGASRRSLDRGVRASSMFLYRTIFNLFPKFIDIVSVIILLYYKSGSIVSLSVGVVASLYMVLTGMIMQWRLPLLRQLNRQQNAANGFAEDALSLAETVAAFGAIPEEEARYSRALKDISKASIRVRTSFAFLKFLQSSILGIGSVAIFVATWHSNKHLSGPAFSSQLAFVQVC
jgi:ABC-type transport system involved in Fe-S cluster assembly fused permease/ATPase subunit